MYHSRTETPDILGAEVSLEYHSRRSVSETAQLYLRDLLRDLQTYESVLEDDQLESSAQSQQYSLDELEHIIDMELENPRAPKLAPLLLTVEDGLRRFTSWKDEIEDGEYVPINEYLRASWDAPENQFYKEK